MSHPFLSLGVHQRNTLFWFFLAAALAIMLVMGYVGEPLITPQAPAGIVSFELAGAPEQAQAILDSWDERAKLYAAFGLGLDYLYMPAYSTAVGLGCLLAAAALLGAGWPLARAGVPLAWGMWLAALFDGVENLGLAFMLLTGETANAWPAIARLSALLKFGLLFLGLFFAFYGLSAGLLRRLARR
jgi:hypothetical protein